MRYTFLFDLFEWKFEKQNEHKTRIKVSFQYSFLSTNNEK
jgi:hypothetical protein